MRVWSLDSRRAGNGRSEQPDIALSVQAPTYAAVGAEYCSVRISNIAQVNNPRAGPVLNVSFHFISHI
jgi:hypothetical protein